MIPIDEGRLPDSLLVFKSKYLSAEMKTIVEGMLPVKLLEYMYR